ncbi:MAG: prenyltransferase/squalene oxidase repeat-containing protein [Planctomycetaceae bacterium]
MAEPPPSHRPRSTQPAAKARRKPLIQTDPNADREPTLSERMVREIRRDWKGVSISLGMHALVLLVLALIPYWLEGRSTLGIINLEWGTTERKQPTAAPVEVVAPIQLTQPRLTNTPKPEAVEPVNPESAAPPAAAPEVAPVVVTGSLSGRQKRDINELLERDGFNEDARTAINSALVWLRQQQFPDGHWSLDGPYRDGATRSRWSTDVGATGLALLAFLGDGQSPIHGDHQQVVTKGLEWLLTQQKASGEVYDGVEQGEEPSIYAHAISTIVLCEAILLTGDERYRGPAQKGIDYLVARRTPCWEAGVTGRSGRRGKATCRSPGGG